MAERLSPQAIEVIARTYKSALRQAPSPELLYEYQEFIKEQRQLAAYRGILGEDQSTVVDLTGFQLPVTSGKSLVTEEVKR